MIHAGSLCDRDLSVRRIARITDLYISRSQDLARIGPERLTSDMPPSHITESQISRAISQPQIAPHLWRIAFREVIRLAEVATVKARLGRPLIRSRWLARDPTPTGRASTRTAGAATG